jgi:hypothetical protein
VSEASSEMVCSSVFNPQDKEETNMRQLRNVIKLVMFGAVTAMALAACSGGGGSTPSSTTPPAAKTLSGTAAAGAPIIGTVTIKDSTTPVAQTKFVTIEANGKYTVDVTGLKAPYMVRADGYVGGNEYHLYSAATQADVGGTINITPLTDLIVANIAGSVAKTYFDNNSFSGLTAAQLTTQSDALKAKLLPVLQALGVSDSIDLLRASFSTDHTGLDAALDVLRVTTNTTTGVATITNIITQQQMTSNVTTGAYTGVLDDTTGVATGVTDIQAISEGFKTFSALFVTSIPSETNATLLSLFDNATFLFQGQNLASFLSQITTDPSMIGISFTNIYIISMDTATGTALVAFDVMQNGTSQNDAPESWNMIKKADGKWYMQGDLRIAQVSVEPRAEYDSQNQINTGLHISIEDRGGRGITSAVVTGAGLTSPVTLVNQINNDWFTIQDGNNGSMYRMNDTQIAAIADTGEVYTVQLYTGSTLTATYTEKIKKRPYMNTALTAASFPTITAPTLAQLRSFNGGTVTVSWTLPAGLTNDWLQMHLGDNSGNSARAEYSLAPTDTSKTIILDAKTSTGQTFTPTDRRIWLSAWDSFGRQLARSFGSNNSPPIQIDSYVSIEGNVYASAGSTTPIAGAVVSTSLDAQTATTDAAGHFFLQTSTLANYSTTPYTITISKTGYPTFSQLWNWGDHPTGQTFNFDNTFGI